MIQTRGMLKARIARQQIKIAELERRDAARLETLINLQKSNRRLRNEAAGRFGA